MLAITSPHLSITQAARLIQQERGFIPVKIEQQENSHRIVWLNVGDYQFTESKFRYSIEHLAEKQQQQARFTTDLQMMASNEFLEDTIYPTGFIFHMSRCGSTVLAKALARVPAHIVIDEGTPLNDGLWHYLTNGWQTPAAPNHENLTLFRNIVLALGRKRTPDHQRYFVKFRSWNTIFIDFIRRAFPDVPCLFIYRDPAEVLVSAFMRPVWVLDFKGMAAGGFLTATTAATTAAMTPLEFLTICFTRYLATGLTIESEQFQYLNYEQIKADNLPAILQLAFNYTVTPTVLEQMRVQFSYYSKDDSNTRPFLPDKEEKQRAITPEIKQAVAGTLHTHYQALNHSIRNLNNRL